jgi:hypothetical protein
VAAHCLTFTNERNDMEDEITLKLTSKKLDIIANALGMRPYIEVAELLQDIGRQVQAQQPQTGAALASGHTNGAGADHPVQ